ncbi:unnamed protein product, partial [Ixodes pacificus]
MESECFPAVPVSTATGQSAGSVVIKQEPMSPPPAVSSPPPPPAPTSSSSSQSRRHASSSSRLLSSALSSAPLAGPGALTSCVSTSGQPLQQQQQLQQQSLLKQPTIVLAAARSERHLVFPKVNIKLEPPSGFVLPPTPPSSHSSDSDGSLSPVHSTDNRTPTSFTAAAPTGPGSDAPVTPHQGTSHHASSSSSSSSMSRRSQSHSRVAATSSSSSS